MAMSVNGYIAKENGETHWSDEEWRSFSEKVKEFACIIIGRKTYEIMRGERVSKNKQSAHCGNFKTKNKRSVTKFCFC